jgi:protein gp37
MTKIEWTNETWNPVTGCTKISPGCRNCYAERMAKRLAGRYGYPRENPFEPATIHFDKLDKPFGWKKPRHVFVCSMSDLFHEAVPRKTIEMVLDICRRASMHTFQLLTKRADRLVRGFEFPKNVWVGVTAENQDAWDSRTPFLRQVAATVRFVSLEPLLSDIEMGDIQWLDWVLTGSEAGPGARPMDEDWVRNIRDQVKARGIPFFYKQRMEGGKRKSMPPLDGIVWNEHPSKSTHL